MKRKLFIVGAVFVIVTFGAAALNLSIRQERSRNQPVADQVNAPAENPVAPTPTLQTSSSVSNNIIEALLITHTVRSGETLLEISLNYDVSIDDIIQANEIDNPDVLSQGQNLLIPGVKPTATISSVELSELDSIELLPKPQNVMVNGLVEGQFLIIPEEVKANARQIFLNGQSMNRNPRAFSVVGDSTTEIPFFLARFDAGPYVLGEYEYLQSVIDYFNGSFSRDSVAVRIGLHSYTLFDPTWADKALCLPNEAVLECEIRLHNPSIVFFRLGSNDVGVAELFDQSMREAVQFSIDNGVIPVIGTKADRFEGSNQNNEILRSIAADYNVPLWEFDIVAGTIDGRGLDSDGVHMTTFYPHDYTQPDAFTRGHSLHNLTALMMLDTLMKEVILAAQG